MNLPSLDPRSDIKSYLRCPRTTCPDYGKRLLIDTGQSENGGEIETRHYCLCGYSERGPANPTVARKGVYMAELLARVRAGRDYGVEIPMRTDLPAVEEVETL